MRCSAAMTIWRRPASECARGGAQALMEGHFISDVDEYRRGLTPPLLAMVDALRDIVRGSYDGLSERIKWNAPSFAIGDQDRITLGVARNGAVRLVLHRGAKVKDSSDYQFDDHNHLASWVASDRGVIMFADIAEIEAKRAELTDLCSRWLTRTA